MVIPWSREAMGDAEARNREWLVARHYAHLLRQGVAPAGGEEDIGIDPAIRLAPGEWATFRTIAVVEWYHGSGERRGGPGPRAPGQRARGWGDRQAAPVLATTERLVVNHRLRGWQSFWMLDLVDYDTSLAEPLWWLDVTWSSVRLRLSGLAVPLLAVFVASTSQPLSWASDPRLAPLLR